MERKVTWLVIVFLVLALFVTVRERDEKKKELSKLQTQIASILQDSAVNESVLAEIEEETEKWIGISEAFEQSLVQCVGDELEIARRDEIALGKVKSYRRAARLMRLSTGNRYALVSRYSNAIVAIRELNPEIYKKNVDEYGDMGVDIEIDNDLDSGLSSLPTEIRLKEIRLKG